MESPSTFGGPSVYMRSDRLLAHDVHDALDLVQLLCRPVERVGDLLPLLIVATLLETMVAIRAI